MWGEGQSLEVNFERRLELTHLLTSTPALLLFFEAEPIVAAATPDIRTVATTSKAREQVIHNPLDEGNYLPVYPAFASACVLAAWNRIIYFFLWEAAPKSVPRRGRTHSPELPYVIDLR